MARNSALQSKSKPAARPALEGVVAQEGAFEPANVADNVGQPVSLGEVELPEARLQELLAQLALLPKRSLLVLNADIPLCVGRALAAAERVKPLLPALRHALREFDFELVECLEAWALVLHYTHAQLLACDPRRAPAGKLLTDAMALRKALLRDVRGLVERELIPREALRSLKGTTGFASLANDLQALHQVVAQHAPLLSGRCPITAEESAQARALSEQLIELLGRRKVRTVDAGQELRQRAFTMLVRAYREARAGVLFLRRNQGDADRFVPSLFSHRDKPRKKRRTPQGASAKHTAQQPSHQRADHDEQAPSHTDS